MGTGLQTQIKATDIVYTRTLLKKKGEAAYQQCADRLSPEARTILETSVSGQWVPCGTATEVMEQAAKILYPGSFDDLEKLGGACAEFVFKGIYRIFLRVATLQFLIKHVASVWSLYHSAGKAVVTPYKDHPGAELVVSGAPDVSVNKMRLVSGFSIRALEMAGGKNVRCRLNTADPSAWRFDFTWEA